MTDQVLDCTDLDQYLGKPMQPARLKEPLSNNDIRRWVQAMHYPNRLHYDEEFAEESRFRQLVAPQSFAVATDDGHGAAPACVGRIPQSHLIFGGDEWWFHGPQICAGDLIHNERTPYDYVVKQTKFAGPTCFQRGDNDYYNDRGDKIATQRSTSIRYRADTAREADALADTEDPEWTDTQLVQLEKQKFEYIQTLHALGHGKRSWKEVEVGDELPKRVIGPHTIASLTTEWRAYLFTIWGGVHRRTDLDFEELGFTGEMAGKEQDPVLEKENPEMTDGAYIGPSRGHLFPRWARHVGMPRGYGYGASMGAWILDYLSGWAGEWGRVVHANSAYRGPAFTGDITLLEATVTDKLVDDQGRSVVGLKVKMSNQLGVTLATATAEVELPTK